MGNVKLSSQMLAHIVVENTEQQADVQEKMSKVSLRVPVISRAANIQLTNLFMQARKKILLPRKWGWIEAPLDENINILPANVVQHPEHQKKPWLQAPEEDSEW